jgi:hypothetical protein
VREKKKRGMQGGKEKRREGALGEREGGGWGEEGRVCEKIFS